MYFYLNCVSLLFATIVGVATWKMATVAPRKRFNFENPQPSKRSSRHPLHVSFDFGNCDLNTEYLVKQQWFSAAAIALYKSAYIVTWAGPVTSCAKIEQYGVILKEKDVPIQYCAFKLHFVLRGTHYHSRVFRFTFDVDADEEADFLIKIFMSRPKSRNAQKPGIPDFVD